MQYYIVPEKVQAQMKKSQITIKQLRAHCSSVKADVFDQLVISGGPTRDHFFLNELADIFDCFISDFALEKSETADSSSDENVRAALLSAPLDYDITHFEDRNAHTPDPLKQEYSKIFSKFCSKTS